MLNSCDHLLQIELELRLNFKYIIAQFVATSVYLVLILHIHIELWNNYTVNLWSIVTCTTRQRCLVELFHQLENNFNPIFQLHFGILTQFTISACCVIISIFSACMIMITIIFGRRTAKRRCFRGASTDLLDKTSHLNTFFAFDSHPYPLCSWWDLVLTETHPAQWVTLVGLFYY